MSAALVKGGLTRSREGRGQKGGERGGGGGRVPLKLDALAFAIIHHVGSRQQVFVTKDYCVRIVLTGNISLK